MPSDSTPEPSAPPWQEAHRALARELHLSSQRAYTCGGLSTILVVASFIAIGVFMGQATQPLPYVTAVMCGLVVLYFAKRLIDAHIQRLRERLRRYCESNDIEFEALIEYFTSRDYTMLAALRPSPRAVSADHVAK